MSHSKSSITLKEISRVSGYSVSTVSKALNNKEDINIHTRQIIKDIAKKHNYVPNNFAVALRKKRSKTISVILPQVNTDFFSCVLYHIQNIAYSFGYKIMLFQSFEDESKEKECVKASFDGSVDGVIVLSQNDFSAQHNSKENIPFEYIQINNSTSLDRLKKDCVHSFNKLLRRIN